MANTMLIVFMILTIILLFTAMIFSAIGADKSKGVDLSKSPPTGATAEGQERCHKNSMYSALITGVSVAVILAILVIYIYTSRTEIATSAHAYIGKYVPAPAAGAPA